MATSADLHMQPRDVVLMITALSDERAFRHLKQHLGEGEA